VQYLFAKIFQLFRTPTWTPTASLLPAQPVDPVPWKKDAFLRD
jgi:hypothetical protein